MATKQTEVVVLGAGPAGYVCAIRLAQLGKKVTVIDRDEVGGVCLNRGCIPSKALIHAASMVEKMNHMDEMGIEVKVGKIDLPKLMTWKQGVVKKLTGGVAGLLKANGCDFIAGDAKFVDSKTLEVKGKENHTVKFEQCVIATGSRPTALKGFEIDQKQIVDSTGALELKQLPKTMLCIGGGYIGLELGTFYAKMGTKVSVVEAGPQLLGIVDKDLVNVVLKGLKKREVEVMTSTKVKGVKKSAKNVEVTFEGADGKEFKNTYDVVMVTIGRTPNSDNLGLEKIGVKIERGFVVVDNQLRTSVSNLFAIGDIAGQPMLAHKGSKEGLVCAEVIAGKRVIYDVAAVPAVVFVDPEIATVGLTDQEAKAKGIDTMVGTFPFAANGRALSVNESEGMVKIVGDKKTGRLLGVHIVGPEASNLIAEATLALEMGATVEDLALTVHAHPTLPEVIMEAAEATLGHAVHIFQRKTPPRPQANA